MDEFPCSDTDYYLIMYVGDYGDIEASIASYSCSRKQFTDIYEGLTPFANVFAWAKRDFMVEILIGNKIQEVEVTMC